MASTARRDPDLRCHPQVRWAVESDGILLVRRDTGDSQALWYPESVVWDLLSREVPAARLEAVLAAVEGIDLNSAQALIAETIGVWAEDGWLVRGDDNG